METKVESLEPEDSGEHQSDDMDDDSPPHIFVGKDHQAEIPNLATDDERRQYMSNSLDSCMEFGYDFPVFNKKEEELQLHHSSETRDGASSRDGESRMTLSCPASNKTIGDVLSYYYGKFYKTEAYKRWSGCRKASIRRCILQERIFGGWRRQELISRLKSKIIEEAHVLLEKIFKSFSDCQISFVDFVFDLKSAVGTEAFVKAVGIGKGKHDLTGFVVDQSKPNQVLSVQPDMPASKDFSSLSLEDIIKFLTGGFRISKTRSNDLFWEAVWPRLLARGWHSEQPNDVSTTKNCLVFVVPGIQRFSRSELTKGTHYFDSVSDVLKKVAGDPILLEIETDAMGNGVTVEKNGCDTDLKLNQDVSLDGHHEPPKFTIIDTSLVQGEEPSQVREIRNLPVDANISFVPSHHSHKMVSVSSSYEQDTNDRSSNCKEGCARLTADVNGIETFEAYNAGNENQVVSLQNMATASCSVFPVSGHSSNGNGDTVSLTRFFDQKTKGEKLNSKNTIGDTKPAKEAAQLSDLANQPKPETQHDDEVASTTIQAIRTALYALVVSPTAYSSLPMTTTTTTPTAGLSAPLLVNPASLYVALGLLPPSAPIVGNPSTTTSDDADATKALHAQAVSVLNVKALIPITLDVIAANYDRLRCASCGRRIPRTSEATDERSR
ncbi:hypothetical protein GUJ93_ZPchr0013g37897 [Zizania palustris]|uniref:Uncharacterized protein n=1 Tax=Zizania palustris TaxID=103762 RepID=A0A8J6BYI3_ZIZPA|nr:hypothetical protein GUJ93_ZPchr0013g37897 [Zizania palustris]